MPYPFIGPSSVVLDPRHPLYSINNNMQKKRGSYNRPPSNKSFVIMRPYPLRQKRLVSVNESD